ncbi:MAG TPA: tetratricopeptide repeat protein [Chloroflexia bacterium]|nr:tetratricopeptide repeat protein [Chloroflexia bacterium]
MKERAFFGSWLKGRRKELGLSQKDLARAADCSVVSITKIEAGERKPSRQIAELLAQHFGISLEERPAFVEFARVEWPASQAEMLSGANISAPWRSLHTLRILQRLQRRPNNLPAQRTSFVGRDKVVASIASIVRRADARLVSIIGPPGIGKTRLSLRVALEVLEDFRDGAYFVPLAATSDAGMLASTIGQTLKVRESGDRLALDNLKEYLRNRHILLVLDNFEHLIDAAPVVADLLTSAAGLKIIISSREALRVYGEHVVQVPPLEVPSSKFQVQNEEGLPGTLNLERGTLEKYEAIHLFNDRAVAVKHDFAITGDNAGTIAEICRRLDGLPLAIELAAAHANTLSPDAILEKLDNRLQLLTKGPHDLPPRQQTLRAAVDWSYNLLDAEEQQLFRQLSVFSGRWTLASAEAIVAGESPSRGGKQSVASLTKGVESLLSKNLLRQDGSTANESWFSMLETIREYAWEKLLESGEGDIQQRHSDYYLALAQEAYEKLNGADQGAWLERLELEHDNLLGALSYSMGRGDIETVLWFGIGLWRFWELRGHPREGLRWLLAGLNAEERAGVPLPILGNAYNSAGNLAWSMGDFALARKMHEQGLAARREVGDKLRIGSSLNNLGLVAQDLGEYEHARALYEESLEICRELDDKADIASTLNNLAIVCLAQGDAASARAMNEESLGLWRELEDAYGMALSLHNLGEAARLERDYTTAPPLYEQSLELYRELGFHQGEANVLNNMGHVAHNLQDLERATALFREGLLLRREMGDKRAIAESLAAFAGVALSQGQPERSVRLLGAADALLEMAGAPLFSLDAIEYDRTLSASKHQLTEKEWKTAWEEGRGMTVEQAVAYALKERASR